MGHGASSKWSMCGCEIRLASFYCQFPMPNARLCPITNYLFPMPHAPCPIFDYTRNIMVSNPC
ncbi:hypothetical protein [Tolypothrix sp. VBCCA 56010]|uniref:hypothetical protein n=1 Tax=Tolypothrix sp. VBCCA 56010 TaxID=3137731 RepID=UPI003D7E8B9B